MKAILYLIVSFCLFISCSQPKPESNNQKRFAKRVDTLHSVKPLFKNISEEIPANRKINLPFGSELLMNYRFPKSWPNNTDSVIAGSVQDKEVKLDESYYKLDSVKTVGNLRLGKVEQVKLPYFWKFDASLIKNVNTCKYQLPSFGPYECFYVYNRSPKSYIIKEKKGIVFDQQPPIWLQAGNLVLFNPTNGVCKMLNIYLTIAAPFSGYQRYFYITKEKRILIYEIEADEEDTTFSQKYIIDILDNGEIKIKENK